MKWSMPLATLAVLIVMIVGVLTNNRLGDYMILVGIIGAIALFVACDLMDSRQ